MKLTWRTDPERRRKYRRKWHLANRRRVLKQLKEYALTTKYGMTLQQHKEMLRKQKGRCRICKAKLKRMHVDHNHKSGIVRAILCPLCNMGLGHFKDSAKLLLRAVAYLKEIK